MNPSKDQRKLAIKSIILPPKFYSKVCEEKAPEYSDYLKYEIEYNVPNKYEINKKIGRGKYSDVYEGIDSVTDIKYAIKILVPIKKAKIKREAKILTILGTHPNIIKLHDIAKDPVTNHISFIFEYVNIHNFDMKNVGKNFTPIQFKWYFYEILRGVDYCHSMGIMHRDLKPHNILVDMEKKELKIIDWGLAEFYHRNTDYNVRVASRYFKSPELLIDYSYYDYSLDIWSLGCIFAGVIFQKEPFFQGKDNADQLAKIVNVLGTDDFIEYLEKFHIGVDGKLMEQVGKHSKKQWKKFLPGTNDAFATSDALDLLSQMLVIDHSKRISAPEALKHKNFQDLFASKDIALHSVIPQKSSNIQITK